MAQKPLILIVDDDAGVLALVQDLLSEEGYTVKPVSSAFQARGALAKLHPDLIILDRGLPDVEGVDFLKEIRSLSGFEATPILFLTGKHSAAEKVEGLRSGGDDYLAKPFNREELLARVESVLRRAKRPEEPSHVLRAKGILIHLDKHVVEIANKPVHLPPKEFDLLVVLLEKRGRVLNRRFLLEHVWGMGMGLRMNTKTVDVAVGRLRTSLGNFGDKIVAVQSLGYRLDVDD